MLFQVYVSQCDAIRHGINRHGNVEIDLDVSRLPQSDRELLAAEYTDHPRQRVRTLDADGLLGSLREKVATREQEAAAAAAKRERRVQIALTAPVEELVLRNAHAGEVEIWTLPEIRSECWATLPDDPRVIERVERELVPAVKAHNAAARARIAEIEREAELAKLRRHSEDRKTLAEFLAAVPDDALRGALKSIVRSGEPSEIAELRRRIEDASPVVIFGDDDDDEGDEE